MIRIFFKKTLVLSAVHISGEIIRFYYDTDTDLETARKEFQENFRNYSASDPESRDQILTFGDNLIRASDFSSFNIRRG